ncbi:unnamed protein product [Trichogramma brassicae]|uniref:Uncharacterized protein n=1 Tax=Trichogramma brassicae TaxID=86971 RepID=A0A6H5IQ14_9HYME|nr:unnamed protein product [Trichogramma brassicae]
MAVPHVAVRAEFKRAARGYVRRAVDSMNARCSPRGRCRCAGGDDDAAQHRVADADAPVEMMTLLNTAWQLPMRRWRRCRCSTPRGRCRCAGGDDVHRGGKCRVASVTRRRARRNVALMRASRNTQFALCSCRDRRGYGV